MNEMIDYALTSIPERKSSTRKHWTNSEGSSEYIIGDEDTSRLPARETEGRITANKQRLHEGVYQRDMVRVLNRNTLHNFTLKDYWMLWRKKMERRWLEFTKTFFFTSRQTHSLIHMALKWWLLWHRTRFLFLRERHIMQYGDKQSNGKVDEENIWR